MKAIIMAGGKGTRLMPLTKDTPKPMVKILDVPIIEHVINLCKRHGITDVAITVGYLHEKIISYLQNGEKLGINLTYFIENQPLGTAGGVKQASSFINDEEDFFVLSGDAYSQIDLSKAYDFHKKKNSLFTIIAQPHYRPTGLGVLNVDYDNHVSEFIEKPSSPTPSLINTGIYVMNKSILNLIPNGFYDFGKDLLPKLTNVAYAYIDYNYWSDIGTLTSYYKTNLFVVEEMHT